MWALATLNSPFKESMAILSLAASNSASSEDLKETLLKVLEDLSGRGMYVYTYFSIYEINY